MRLLTRVFGAAPADGRSLWISMHGGGGAPAQVNDQQWQNQIRLYEPPEGIYIAPRAPTDNWNLWHEGHIDDLFDRLIENCVLLAGVNPDKVYLMGYSAGGDGVYQLAPRMADRFAAASMMAGHPNDASPLGLRNLPFAIFSGAEDAAYRRNKVAAEWAAKLDALAQQDPGGIPAPPQYLSGPRPLDEWQGCRSRAVDGQIHPQPVAGKGRLVPIRPLPRPLLLARLACRRRQARPHHPGRRRATTSSPSTRPKSHASSCAFTTAWSIWTNRSRCCSTARPSSTARCPARPTRSSSHSNSAPTRTAPPPRLLDVVP